MPRRMIPVRHRETGQETTVSETAWPYFAGHYERLDQPASPQPVPATQAPTTPAAPAAPSTPTPRTTAPKTKE